jgi:Response regulator containing a CheY-like receiver domain and an HTH DNA-binding domain
MKGNFDIMLIENSSIITEGLVGILHKSGLKCRISTTASLEEAELELAKSTYDLVVVNPAFIQNNLKTFGGLKCDYNNTKWVALLFAFYDPKIISMFDATLTISDSAKSIIGTLHTLLNSEEKTENNSLQEILSDREIDVLKLLAKGLANKEIAEKLHISINTVITHRKNISQKTGIKSVSGLTIYAVVQKLVTIDN